jgi:hypothetical protein
MRAADPSRLLRQLPSVDEVLRSGRGQAQLARYRGWVAKGVAPVEHGSRDAHVAFTSAAGVALGELRLSDDGHCADLADAARLEPAAWRARAAIVVFTKEVAPTALAAASRSRKIPVMVDSGAGALLELVPGAALRAEPGVRRLPSVASSGAMPLARRAPARAMLSSVSLGADELAARPSEVRTLDDAELDDVVAAVVAVGDVARGGTLAC